MKANQVVIRNTWDVIMTSLEILQRQQFDAVSCQADVLIQPAVGGYLPQDFDRSRELVDLGREAALARIERSKQLFAGGGRRITSHPHRRSSKIKSPLRSAWLGLGQGIHVVAIMSWVIISFTAGPHLPSKAAFTWLPG